MGEGRKKDLWKGEEGPETARVLWAIYFLQCPLPMATWGTLAEQNSEIWLKPHQEVWAPHLQKNPRFNETPSPPLI